MTRPGPPLLPPGRAAGHRRRDLTILPRGSSDRPTPLPRSDWLAATRHEWARYWASPISRACDEADWPPLYRLYEYKDSWARLRRVARKTPFALGSTGQVRNHPAGDRMLQLESAIVRLESAIGIGPEARLKLGLAVLDTYQTLDDINRPFLEGLADDEPDPRLAMTREQERKQR